MLKILFLLFISTAAFGQDKTICFRADGVVPNDVPKFVCLEEIVDSSEYGYFNIKSKDHSLPSKMKLRDLNRHNEDRFKFTLSEEYQNWDDRPHFCGEAKQVDLVIHAESTAGNVNMESVGIVLEMTETNDACHGWNRISEIKYNRI